RRVCAGLDGRGHPALVSFGETLGPRAGLVIQIPVESFGELDSLRRPQAESVNVGDEDQKPRDLLPTSGHAELGRLLDRVGRVAASVGQPYNFRLGGLRLEEKR